MSKIADSIMILRGLKSGGLASADVGQAIQNLETVEAAYSDLLRVSQHILTRWNLEDPQAVFPAHALRESLEYAILKVKSHA